MLHVKKYEREAPSLDPPTVLGSFSVDSKKNICYDNSMMPVLSTKYIPDGEYMKVRHIGSDVSFRECCGYSPVGELGTGTCLIREMEVLPDRLSDKVVSNHKQRPQKADSRFLSFFFF